MAKETKTFDPIRSHSTATDATGTWDGGAATKAVNANESDLRGAHAYVDPSGDPDAKTSYSFPHHNINADGTPGAANTTACSSGIAALNGARGGHSVPADEKTAVYNHLSKHIADSGAEPPDLQSSGVTADGESVGVIDNADPQDQTSDNTFSMPIMLMEGVWTGDSRFINNDALSWRSLPLPAMAKLTTGGYGHEGASLAGKLTGIERKPVDPDAVDGRTGQPYPEGTSILSAQGKFDTAADAQEVARLISDGMLRGVSADIGDAVSDLVWIDADGNEVEDNDDWDLFDLLFGFTASADGVTLGEKIISGRIMGATICPFPAFEDAYVVIGETAMAASAGYDGERWPSMHVMQKSPRVFSGLTAAAAAPITPPSKWFEDPMFDEINPITVTEDGQIYGHLAAWTDCHIGYLDSCMRAPHSASDYAYFTTGYVLSDDGSSIPTGVITMNTGHAEIWQSPESSKAHYDNTGLVVADIAVGDDPYGIWVAGALRPDVDELTPRRLRGAALSGDWREIGGHLELIAALAVNVQGFPIKRPKARTASGRPVALVAAGAMTPTNVIRLRDRMKKLSTEQGQTMEAKQDSTLATATEILSRQARTALRNEVHRPIK
jgi:hypothetical protein